MKRYVDVTFDKRGLFTIDGTGVPCRCTDPYHRFTCSMSETGKYHALKKLPTEWLRTSELESHLHIAAGHVRDAAHALHELRDTIPWVLPRKDCLTDDLGFDVSDGEILWSNLFRNFAYQVLSDRRRAHRLVLTLAELSARRGEIWTLSKQIQERFAAFNCIADVFDDIAVGDTRTRIVTWKSRATPRMLSERWEAICGSCYQTFEDLFHAHQELLAAVAQEVREYLQRETHDVEE